MSEIVSIRTVQHRLGACCCKLARNKKRASEAMQHVMAALQAWRDAQAQALKAEADLSVALNAEFAGGRKVPEELQARVKQCRAHAEERFAELISLMESRPDLKP